MTELRKLGSFIRTYNVILEPRMEERVEGISNCHVNKLRFPSSICHLLAINLSLDVTLQN